MNESKRKRGTPLVIWLLTVTLSVAAVAGLWLYGRRVPLRANQREAGVPAATSLSLWQESGDYTAEASPAPESTEVVYDYKEILSDEDGILIARIDNTGNEDAILVG